MLFGAFRSGKYLFGGEDSVAFKPGYGYDSCKSKAAYGRESDNEFEDPGKSATANSNVIFQSTNTLC